MPTTATPQAVQHGVLSLARGGTLRWRERPLIMGVLNLTPDSFSDGGRWIDPGAAVERAHRMVTQGADLLDLGAESTRPGGGVYGGGADPVPAEEELRRLLPVLETLRDQLSIPLSVDTRKGVVARAALGTGADLINDISALNDPGLAAAVAESGCPVVLMHSRGLLSSMQRNIAFEDVVEDVRHELEERAERALAYGIEQHQILVDPGIGFGKTAQQNLELLRRLDRLVDLGLPVMVGASRKSFIGEVVATEVDKRIPGSLAAVAWAAHHDAALVRVHDVQETHQFLAVWQAIKSSRRQTS